LWLELWNLGGRGSARLYCPACLLAILTVLPTLLKDRKESAYERVKACVCRGLWGVLGEEMVKPFHGDAHQSTLCLCA
jgi:hypothetical protein